MDAKPGVAGDSTLEAMPAASSRIPHRPKSGLLSSWHTSDMQWPNDAGLQGKASLAEQDTFKQKTVDRQVMEPEVRSKETNLQELANGNSHTAPHDSGISSSPPIPMQPGSDPGLSWRSRQPDPAWPWGSQPPQSQQRPSSLQTLAPPLQPVAQTQARPVSSPLSMPE